MSQAMQSTVQYDMQGMVILVTGGSGGIGSAISQQLAEAGASLIITYANNASRAQALLDELPGNTHMIKQASVTDSQDLKTLALEIEERYGRLDVLVNNAGITKPVPHDDLDALDDQLIDQIFQTNWRGSFACTRSMRKLLKTDSGGVIINISSIAGMTGIGSNVAYCASKAAIDAMTISLGRALAPKIRVLAIAPGWVDGEYAQAVNPEYLKQQVSKTPLGRLATADDVAKTVLAAINAMPFTTGTTISVDGGRPFN